MFRKSKWQKDTIWEIFRFKLQHQVSPLGDGVGNVASFRCQGWNVALSIIIFSARHSLAITSEKHCMVLACRNLQV